MSAMTYKEKRELRRAAMAPQLADIIEGFIVGSCFLYLAVVFSTGGLQGRCW